MKNYMYQKSHPILFLGTLLALSCNQQPKAIDMSVPVHISRPSVADAKPIYTPQTPEETIKSISVPEGYKLELVASEPMIEEPVAISWDPNGRLFVAEMRTYMQDGEPLNSDDREALVADLAAIGQEFNGFHRPLHYLLLEMNSLKMT